jgi:hypothetical protein
MHAVRTAARLLVAATVLITIGACTNPGPGGGPPHTSRPPGTRPPVTRPDPPAGKLLEFTTSGGDCGGSVCGHQVTVYQSGAWHSSLVSPEHNTQVEGQLDPATTRDLADRIQREVGTLADLPRLPGPCPLPVENGAITVTVYSGGKPTTVTCDAREPSGNVEIPGTNPLLLQIGLLVDGLSRAGRPSTIVVQYHESGGRCVETCPEERAEIVLGDGSWAAVSGTTKTSGRLDEATVAELRRRIESQAGTLADLPPSTGCPSQYDGRDVRITFHIGSRTIEVSNCTKDFEGNALLDYTQELISGFFE